MKPTERIIELSKRLHELGYRKEIEVYDRAIIPGCNSSVVVTLIDIGSVTAETDIGFDVVLSMLIPIPSLEDGLEWLSKNLTEWVMFGESGITFELYTEDGHPLHEIAIKADTPHEVVLMAIKKVLLEEPK